MHHAAQDHGHAAVDLEVVRGSLALEGVDALGLDELDRRVLHAIITRYDGGPVGIEALAATLQEEVDTLTDVVEPYLLKEGFLKRTQAGRMADLKAYEHLHLRRSGRQRLDYAAPEQPELPLD